MVDVINWTPQRKWMRDPGARSPPRDKHYVNGQLVSENSPSLREASTSPFRRQRVPRRGFIAIPQDDPEYSRLCNEQGNEDGMVDAESPPLLNGVHSSPTSTSSPAMAAAVNGLASPTRNTTAAISEAGNQPISPTSETGPAQARPLVNGVHGMPNGDPE